ncbi:MAG: A24 family peptidase [Actinomycetia bacterium]|nr:A24 family peptidase [Actinomycetes bacterium]
MVVLACLAVLTWTVALSVLDLRQRRLPNVLTLTGAVVIVAVCAGCGRGSAAVLGALGLGGLYLAVHLCAPAGMGGGDVKLALGLGALTGALGAPIWLLAALGAPVLTVILGAIVALRRRGSLMGTVVPHGPSMCLASLAAAAPAVF